MDILAAKKRSNIVRNNKIENRDMCSKCNGKLDEFFVCENCGNNSYMPAQQRINMIADDNTFEKLEFDTIDISKKCN